jgi:hypothetical protein
MFDFDKELSFYIASWGDSGTAKYFREFAKFKFVHDKLKAENAKIRARATDGAATGQLAQAVSDNRSPAPQVFGKMPEEIKSLQDKAKKLYKDTVYLHDGLAASTSIEDRRATAEQILANFKSLSGWWDQLDKYTKTGELPAPDRVELDLVSIDEADLLRRSNNLKTYIAKYKDRGDEKGKAKFEAYMKEYETIKKQLDAF